MIKDILFPKDNHTRFSLALLLLRVVVGVLFLMHGWQKVENFTALSETFPDPLGLGSQISLSLAIFAELACSLAFIVGLLYRLALVPMIFTMVIAFFVVHGGDAKEGELALIYLVLFVGMWITGAGEFALDRLFSRK